MKTEPIVLAERTVEEDGREINAFDLQIGDRIEWQGRVVEIAGFEDGTNEIHLTEHRTIRLNQHARVIVF
jgi:hypothetical protein